MKFELTALFECRPASDFKNVDVAVDGNLYRLLYCLTNFQGNLVNGLHFTSGGNLSLTVNDGCYCRWKIHFLDM